MKLGAAGEKMIKRHEGEGPAGLGAPYLDDAGIPTTGWGCIHRRDGSRVEIADPRSSPEECEWLFARDTGSAVGAVNRLIVRPMTQNQFDAFVDFAFNEGNGALQVSAMRNAFNAGSPVTEDMFARWDKLHVGGVLVPSAGLLKRRREEFALFGSP